MKQAKVTRMTKGQYASAIDELGLTQVGAAEFLKIGERTSRRWIAGESAIPFAVCLLLTLMIDRKIKPDDLKYK